MHHALADGVAANALLGNIVDGLGGDPRPARDRPQRRPGARAHPDLVRRSCGWPWSTRSLQIGSLPGLLSRTVQGGRPRCCGTGAPRRSRCRARCSTYRARRSTARSPRAATSPPPPCRIAEIKEVQRAHGVTMNDVVLAVVGGAAAPLAAGRGASCPTRSLVAGVPVATDAAGRRPAARRQPGLEHLHLAGHRHRRPARAAARRSPGPRASPSSSTDAGPEHARRLGAVRPAGAAERGDAALLALAAPPRTTRRRSTWWSPTCAVPASRSRSRARALRDLFSVGPILEGIGLNVTAWSYVRPDELLLPQLPRPGRTTWRPWWPSFPAHSRSCARRRVHQHEEAETRSSTIRTRRSPPRAGR